MANKALPAQDVLLQLLSYNPITGELFWKPRGVEWFSEGWGGAKRAQASWNARYAGKPALHTVCGNGYREGHLNRRLVKSHRVIWKMITGEEPDQVDHINGVRSDNRWENLRDVDQNINQRNAKKRHDNTSGYAGVTLYTHERRNPMWLVKIGNKHVGYFQDLDEAVAARKAAEVDHGFHPNHGRP